MRAQGARRGWASFVGFVDRFLARLERLAPWLRMT
jgi:hypothetical protein